MHGFSSGAECEKQVFSVLFFYNLVYLVRVLLLHNLVYATSYIGSQMVVLCCIRDAS